MKHAKSIIPVRTQSLGKGIQGGEGRKKKFKYSLMRSHCCCFYVQRCNPDKICSTQLEMIEFTKMEQELMINDPQEKKPERSKWLSLAEWKKRLYTEEAVLAVDELSLIVFPISFGVFNIVYWIAVARDT